MKLEVVVNSKTLTLELAASATFGDLMTDLQSQEGIDIAKQVLLYDCKEFRKPEYEDGKLVVYDGQESCVSEDRLIREFIVDESEQFVCGELQDEWLEKVTWGAFGHTVYEADYLKHRVSVIFNGQLRE